MWVESLQLDTFPLPRQKPFAGVLCAVGDFCGFEQPLPVLLLWLGYFGRTEVRSHLQVGSFQTDPVRLL